MHHTTSQIECARESLEDLVRTGPYWTSRPEYSWGSAFQMSIREHWCCWLKALSVRNKAPGLGNWLWLTWWLETVLTTSSSQECQYHKGFLVMGSWLSEQIALDFKNSHMDTHEALKRGETLPFSWVGGTGLWHGPDYVNNTHSLKAASPHIFWW